MNDLLMALGLLALLVLVVLDAALLISVLRQGDERRQMIVGRASTHSFAAMALYMVLCVVEDLYRRTGSGPSGRSAASPRRSWPDGAGSPARPSTPSRTTSTTPPWPWPSTWPGSWGPRWTSSSSPRSEGPPGRGAARGPSFLF